MKSIIKKTNLGLALAISFSASAAQITEYHNEVLLALAQISKKYDPAVMPNASQAFYSDLCRAIDKPNLNGVKDQLLIDTIVKRMNPDFKKDVYKSLTLEDKKFAIEGLIAEFFNKNNKDSLAKFIDMLVFIVLEGQQFKELVPVLQKHQKELDDIKNTKPSKGWPTKLLLLGLKKKVEAILKSVPKGVVDDVKKAADKAKGNFKLDRNQMIAILEQRVNANAEPIKKLI